METCEYDKYVIDFFVKFNEYVKTINVKGEDSISKLINLTFTEIILNEMGVMNIGKKNIVVAINAINGYINHLLEFSAVLEILFDLHEIFKQRDFAMKIMKLLPICLSQNIKIHIYLVAYVIIYNYEVIENHIMTNGRIEYDCNTEKNNTGGIQYGYIIDIISHCALQDDIKNHKVSRPYLRISVKNTIEYCEKHSIIRNEYRSKINSVIKLVLSDDQIKKINEYFDDANVNSKTLYFVPDKSHLYNRIGYFAAMPSCAHSITILDHTSFTLLKGLPSADPSQGLPLADQMLHGKYLNPTLRNYEFHDIHGKDDFVIMYPYDRVAKNESQEYVDNHNDFVYNFIKYNDIVRNNLINVLEDKNIIITESMMIFITRYYDYESFILAIQYGGIITEKVLESACNINIGYASPIEKYRMISICCKHVKPTKTAFRNIVKSRDYYSFDFVDSWLKKGTTYSAVLEPYFPRIDDCFSAHGREILINDLFSDNNCNILDYISLQDDHMRQYGGLSFKYRKYESRGRDFRSKPYAYYYALNEAIKILIKNGFKIEYDDLLFAYKNDVILSSTFISGIIVNKCDFSKSITLKKGICINYYNDLINTGILKVSDNKSDGNIIDDNKDQDGNKDQDKNKDLDKDKNLSKNTESKISEEYYKGTNCGIIDDSKKFDDNIITFINDDIKKLLKIKDPYVTYIHFRQKMMKYISNNNFITDNEIKLPEPFTFNNKTSIKIVDINNWILSLLNTDKSNDIIPQNEENIINNMNYEEKHKIKTILDIDDIDDTDENGMRIKKRQRIPKRR